MAKEGAGATLAEGRGGLRKVVLAHPSGSAAEVYPYGAHVVSWTVADGGEMLFLSERARFGGGRSIRGGIPVIFPQFADQGPLPKHGFARTAEWEVASLDAENGAAAVRLVLRDTPETRAIWPHAFEAELSIALADTLRLVLTVTNRGGDTFAFTTALHTYFRVDDIARARISGLQGVAFLDKTQAGRERTEDGALALTAETDGVYPGVPGPVRIAGAAGGRIVTMERDGFPDVVVWNPGADAAAKLDDMEADEYRRMLCVEAAVVTDPVHLGPGETWRGTLTLAAEKGNG
jgi:glucose-6-phosphate 1-epimerase